MGSFERYYESFQSTHKLALKVLERHEKGHNVALDGDLDAFIASLAHSQAWTAILRGGATDSQIREEWDKLSVNHFETMLLAYGIPMDLVFRHAVGGRDWFIEQYHAYIELWFNDDL